MTREQAMAKFEDYTFARLEQMKRSELLEELYEILINQAIEMDTEDLIEYTETYKA